MSLLNKTLMGLSLVSSKVINRRFPLVTNWAITGRCNLRCRHCYGGYGIVQKDELPTDIIKKTIDGLKKMGTRRITIEGGEPLIREDIREIVDYVHQKNIEMSLCTNGVLLEKHIDFLKDKIDLVVFSLDGNEAHNDSVRGKGNFSNVMEALELAKKFNIRTLIFSCLIDDNISDVDFLIDTAKKFGTSIAFNLAVAKINKEGSREALNKKTENDYKSAFQKILDYKKNGAPVFYSEDNFRQILNWPSFEKEKYFNDEIDSLTDFQKRTMIHCYAGINYCYIECNGDVYPCYQMVGVLKVKNIKTDGVENAFEYLSQIDYCKYCYNVTLSELNLQSNLNLKAVFNVLKNYMKSRGFSTLHLIGTIIYSFISENCFFKF